MNEIIISIQNWNKSRFNSSKLISTIKDKLGFELDLFLRPLEIPEKGALFLINSLENDTIRVFSRMNHTFHISNIGLQRIYSHAFFNLINQLNNTSHECGKTGFKQ